MKNPEWIVKEVIPQKDYTLIITFIGGEKRVYDARPLLNKNIFSSLKDINYFMRAKVSCGTVVWDDTVDIAPEHLYECSTPLKVVK